MSKHGALALHLPEEAIAPDIHGILQPIPGALAENPISEYFYSANSLTTKIARSSQADDSEILGLLLLGIVSAAEFYFRAVFGVATSICPACKVQAEMQRIPIGSFAFYENTGYSHTLSAYEHESLADSKKIVSECKKFTGLDISTDTSALKAITDFEILCELRHCLVHARGFAGLKACVALKTEKRKLQKLLVGKSEAFELIKISHNAVRAVNRFIANGIVNRWIDQDLLTGIWKTDREIFTELIEAFWIRGEDNYKTIPFSAYRPFRKAILAKQKAMEAQVKVV